MTNEQFEQLPHFAIFNLNGDRLTADDTLSPQGVITLSRETTFSGSLDPKGEAPIPQRFTLSYCRVEDGEWQETRQIISEDSPLFDDCITDIQSWILNPESPTIMTTDIIVLALLSFFYLSTGIIALWLFAEFLQKIVQLTSFIIDIAKGIDTSDCDWKFIFEEL